jgi:hypothetical protein
MPFYAEYDPSVASPSPVKTWYDVHDTSDNPSGFKYPTLPPGERLYSVTPEQWTEHMKDPSGWAISDGALVPHVRQPTAEWLKNDLILQAKAALGTSTQTVVLRCFEEAMPVPAEWKAYRDALRQVIDGTLDTMPEEPPMPAF